MRMGRGQLPRRARAKARAGRGALPFKPKAPMWMGTRTQEIPGLKAGLGPVVVGVRAEKEKKGKKKRGASQVSL